jgi:hypothetical protein
MQSCCNITAAACCLCISGVIVDMNGWDVCIKCMLYGKLFEYNIGENFGNRLPVFMASPVASESFRNGS